MTNPIAIRYPLDLTGINPNNLVTNEPQTLLDNPNRAVVPNYGPFYTKGLIVSDAATGQPLTKTTQYICAQLHKQLTLETGLEVMQVIVIVDPTVSNNINITYQVVGGEYAYSVDALIQMLAALQLDNQPVSWGQILGKPSAFPPTQHLHDIGDTYGWEYVVDALETLRQAVLVGDQAAFDNLIGYINAAVASMNATVAGFNSLLTAHVSNLENPHQDTKTLIGLGNVQNFGIATQADVIAGTNNALYVTPLAVAGVGLAAQNALEAHITDYQNPHNVTAAQVNLGNVGNYGMATNAQAITGTSVVLYMNPANTAAAITAQAFTPLNTALNAHIANTGNPHNTTAAQVNLGNVPNYPMATLAQAEAGTSTTTFMSPALVASAISTLASAGLAAHIADHANPHDVTAAQVGLGSVNNTSDINKPVSTATQNALNAKATLNAGVAFAAIAIGSGDPYLYEYETGGFAIRTGTSSANWSYTTFDPSGNFTIGGKVTAGGGFQPSDKRFKDVLGRVDARPLWREIDFMSWNWKDAVFGHTPGEFDRGYIAQDVRKRFPEFTYYSDLPLQNQKKGSPKKFLSINTAAMAMEMSAAAGRIVDVLLGAVEEQQTRLNAQDARIDALERLVKRLTKGA